MGCGRTGQSGGTGAGGGARADRAAAAPVRRRFRGGWPWPAAAVLPLLLLLLLLLVLLAGCATAPPGWYRIQQGDTLSEIAERRGVSLRRLAAWNGLRKPYRIYAGTLLRVQPPDGSRPPAGERTATVVARGKPRVTASRGAGQSASRGPGRTSAGSGARPVRTTARPPVVPGSAGPGSGVAWQWPVSGPVVQRYVAGERSRQGLRIAVPLGAPVAAAADGSVVYAGSGLKSYGNLIILRHSDRFLSAYGFNRRLLAAEGQQVRRGQPVAEAGSAADGRPMLHFEIRRDGATVDPLLYLPAAR